MTHVEPASGWQRRPIRPICYDIEQTAYALICHHNMRRAADRHPLWLTQILIMQMWKANPGAHWVMRISLTHSGLLASSSGCSSRLVISSAAAWTRGHSCAAEGGTHARCCQEGSVAQFRSGFEPEKEAQ